MHHPLAHVPDHDELAEALERTGSNSSAPEVQGLISGLVAGGARLGKAALRKVLEAHLELSEALGDELTENLWAMSQAIAVQLADSELSFDLMLPDDDESLEIRVISLGQWCEGFLVGFGTAARNVDDAALGENVRNSLADIVEIANVDPTADDGSDSDEDAYMELCEYVRMAAVMVFTEMAPKEEHLSTNNPPVH